MKFGIATLALVSAVLSVSAKADDDEKTCNLWQVCKNHESITPGTLPDSNCANGSDVSYPVFVDGNFAPALMDPRGVSAMTDACPFYDLDNTKLCCNSDTASIMRKYSSSISIVIAIR